MYSAASACIRRSAIMRVSVCSRITIVAFGFILLTSSTLLTHDKDKQDEKLSLVKEQSEASAALGDSHSGGKQLGTTETEILKETPTVSRKLRHSLHHKSAHFVPRPPVLSTDLPSSPAEVVGASTPTLRSLRRVPTHIFSRMRRTIRLQRTTATRSAYSGKNADNSAAFHVDYSGPKTHPPRNN